MSKEQIKQANNNMERQNTYRYLLGRYNKAMKNGFYFESLIIAYAVLEDRLKAFLYHCGVLTNRNNLKVNKKVKDDICAIVYDEKDVPVRISFRNISTKGLFVRRILEWTDATTADEISTNEYMLALKSQIESLDIGGFLDVLDELTDKESGWLSYRNEIIHASMNKNIESIYIDLEENVAKGMEYARFIDNQVRILRDKGTVRKKLKMQNN